MRLVALSEMRFITFQIFIQDLCTDDKISKLVARNLFFVCIVHGIEIFKR